MFNFVYVYDGSDIELDEFVFILENLDGGFIGIEIFDIVISEGVVVNIMEEGLNNDLLFFFNFIWDEVMF